MLDIALIREQTAHVRQNLKKRNNPAYLASLDTLLSLDKDWRAKKQELDDLRQHRNKISQAINAAKKDGKDIKKIVQEAKELPNKVRDAELKSEELQKQMQQLLMRIPNMLHTSVPEGKDETQNKVIKEFGKKTKYKFTPVSHADLLPAKGWADFERAAKISGARWYFLKEELAVLEMALVRYGIDFMRKHGYTFVVPPHMISRAAYEGVTDIAAFADALYKMEGEDLYAIATSEHPLTASYMNELLQEEQLPVKLTGFSTNFRKEAGAHGKDQKGIFRVHQFGKVEQVIVCKPEDSWQLHEELAKNAIEFWKSLEIPFRQIALCSADTGVVMAKTYDLEAWFPVQNAWREVVSCSNATDYQARRLNIKYLKGDDRVLCHTLNSTLVATTRALVAIVENFQNEDGSVNVPKILQKYAGFKVMGVEKKAKKKKK